jgi:hypothetical protein
MSTFAEHIALKKEVERINQELESLSQSQSEHLCESICIVLDTGNFTEFFKSHFDGSIIELLTIKHDEYELKNIPRSRFIIELCKISNNINRVTGEDIYNFYRSTFEDYEYSIFDGDFTGWKINIKNKSDSVYIYLDTMDIGDNYEWCISIDGWYRLRHLISENKYDEKFMNNMRLNAKAVDINKLTTDELAKFNIIKAIINLN